MGSAQCGALLKDIATTVIGLNRRAEEGRRPGVAGGQRGRSRASEGWGQEARDPGKLSAPVTLLGVPSVETLGPVQGQEQNQAGLGAEPRTLEEAPRAAPEARPRPERAPWTPGPQPSDAGVCSEQLPGDKYNKVY